MARLALIATFFLAGCGMHFSEESKSTHRVHVGDTARLWAAPDYKYSFVATARENCYELQSLLAKNDFDGIRQLAEKDKVFSTDPGAKVKVLREAYNEREVKILEGTAEGRTGWVVFEWLKPLQPGDN